MFQKFNSDEICAHDVIEKFGNNELFLLANTIVEMCTITLCIVFFVMIARNFRRAR